jgi:ureidoglycolate dehydrogenase (NAD+)
METNHSGSINIQAKLLHDFAIQALSTVGFDALSARTTAEGLVSASLRGVDSHGIRLLPHYVRAAKAGRLSQNPEFKFDQTGLSTGTLDADDALGFPAGVTAVDHAMAMARETGIGCVSVYNSSHCGMLAYYAIEAAKKGFFALVFTNTTPRLIPTNSRRPFLGTNPFCYAFPIEGEDPICYDAATTQITGNKIQLYRQLGLTLPDGVATDSEGNITTDSQVAEYLMPFGDYKGFGIAMLIDILCGVLCGMPNGNNVSAMYGKDISQKRLLGQFYLLLDISKFRPAKVFAADLKEEIERLRNLPALDGKSVMAPGDPEKIMEAARSIEGIPLEKEIVASLASVAIDLGITNVFAEIA